MADVIRSNTGISIPISGDDAQLKKQLEDLKRTAQSPNLIKITPTMSFDEKQVTQAINREMKRIERDTARQEARVRLFGADYANGGGNGTAAAQPVAARSLPQGAFSAFARDAFGGGSYGALGAAATLGAGYGVARAATGAINFGVGAYDAAFGNSLDAREAGRQQMRSTLTGIPAAGPLGEALNQAFERAERHPYSKAALRALVPSTALRDVLPRGMTDEEDRRAAEDQQIDENRTKARDQRISRQERQIALRRAMLLSRASLTGNDVLSAKLANQFEVEDADLLGLGGMARENGSTRLDVAQQRRAYTIASIKQSGRNAQFGNALAQASVLGDYGQDAMLLRQEMERQNLLHENAGSLVGVFDSGKREAQERANKQRLDELDARHDIERDEAKKHRSAELTGIVASENDAQLRINKKFYEADLAAFDEVTNEKASLLHGEEQEGYLRTRAAGRSTLVAGQATARAISGFQYSGRVQSADLRASGYYEAANLAGMIAGQRSEAEGTDASERGSLLRAQAHELKAYRTDLLRPRGYLQATDPLSELPGGPGGQQGAEMVRVLQDIDDRMKELVSQGGGAVLQ